jgi:hypothetical protein
MEHYGCTCGDPLIQSSEITALYEFITMSPVDAGECRQKQYELTLKALTEENYKLKESVEFWQGTCANLILPSPILALDKPKKE